MFASNSIPILLELPIWSTPLRFENSMKKVKTTTTTTTPQPLPAAPVVVKKNSSMNMLAAVVNSTSEVPSTMAAYALLGGTRFFTTASFAPIPVSAVVNLLVTPDRFEAGLQRSFPRQRQQQQQAQEEQAE